MKRTLQIFSLLALLSMLVFGQEKSPEIQVIDGKLSLSAEGVPLSVILQRLNQATGTNSRVLSSELGSQNISVQFSGLGFDDAVRKIFEGQPLDYVLINGQGVVVTARSVPPSTTTVVGAAPVFQQPAFEGATSLSFQENNAAGFPPAFPPGVPPLQQQPGVSGVPVPGVQQQQQPPVVQTIFGAITNPRADGVVPGSPVGPAGVYNPLTPNPLGSTLPNPNPVNTLFGNTSPAPFTQAPTAPPKN